MKKLISLLLALTMVFSLAICASAAEGDNYTGVADTKATIVKNYAVNNGKSPNAEFSYTIVFDHFVNNEGETTTVENAPVLTVGPTKTLANKDAANLTETLDIDLTAFADMPLGIYYYNITEVIPEAVADKVAGVTYDETPVLLLKVTVYRDEDSNKHYVGALRITNEAGLKDNNFHNSYDAGQLTVTKQITGNAAEMDKQFKFTVTFSHDSKFLSEINATFAQNDEAAGYDKPVVSEDGLTYTFYLGDNESAVFANLPAGTKYTVTEDKEKYTIKSEVYTDENKTIAANDTDSVTFTNELVQNVDTGITLDSMPFVLILAVCAGAAVLFVIKRRSVEF